jgi:hypothetical protein
MMYANKLAVAIKVGGRVLREYKDTVYIPYGSEYSVLLKNLNTTRMLVNVYIDGDNIVPGGLVLHAGQEVDLERSIKNNNLYEGNKFKFIERTGKIEAHRGIKIEDGLIRVEFQHEKVYQRIPPNTTEHWQINNYSFLRGSAGNVIPNQIQCTATNVSYNATVGASSAQLNNAIPTSEVGITVPGSKSEQKFVTVSNFTCEPEKHNVILKLLGETEDNKMVREPVTVKHKQKCPTCNHTNKASAKFCSECGTHLTVYA